MQKADTDALEARILDDPLTSLAVSIALDKGLLAGLRDGQHCLSSAEGVKGDKVLCALLHRAHLLVETADGLVLDPIFAALLDKGTDSLEARLRFHRMALADLMWAGDALLYDLPQFMARAATFKFFDYGRAMSTKAAALEDTANWVDYVSALTALEAGPLAAALPLSGVETVLEIGGNSGVFAQELIKRVPDLHVTILDLPAVCHLGIAARDASGLSPAQLAFVPGDVRQAEWPKPDGRPADAVLFKSVLHDWDIGSVRKILRQAVSYLSPGSAVIICERGPVEDEQDIGFAALAANLVFSPFYRAPAEYVAVLEELGLRVEDVGRVKLDMTFNIVVARVPS